MDDLADLIDKRRRSALSLDDFSLLESISGVLDKHLPNEQSVLLIDEIREVILGKRHPAGIKDLHTLVKNCTKCEGFDPFLPKGNVKNPQVVFVTEQINVKSLQFLTDCLRSCGISSKDVVLTRLVRCNFVKITDEHVNNCLPYFWEELKLWKPRLVVLLGSFCSKTILGDIKITQERGQRFWLNEYCFMPTYGPAHAANNEGSERQFMEDMKLVKTYITGDDNE